MSRFDTLYRNARLETLNPALLGLGLIEPGAIAIRDGRIAWVGSQSELPTDADAPEIIDCDGRWITPGLIDCHTHLVYGGDRALEFEMRLAGASYEEIARAGGGIVSTVKATRAASEAELLTSALPRLDALLAEGVTSIEIKSGYGLDLESEAKMLRVARLLGSERPVSVTTTCLAAHALPPEFTDDRQGYLRLVIDEILPTLAAEGLADAVDGFVEGIAFSPDEMALVFDKARALGLPIKLHADQLSNLGGAALAARHGALSADHLEYADDSGVAAMASAGTVAVLLPGAFYVLREKQVPPVAMLRKHGVPIAVATDSNPGTSPITSLLTTMNMAATLFGLTVEECLGGVTREAARALGRLDSVGSIEAGKWADLCIWDIKRPAELVYRIGFNPLLESVWHGQRKRRSGWQTQWS
jgi:imidazolonepropionase